jgi:MFS superfamily sulfate permease-like transporter
LRAGALRGDLNGAFGDLGTFLPYVVAAVSIGGLAATGVLLGFGVLLIASGLFYGMPMAVQPMKAVTAALLTSSLTPGEIAAAGIVLGAVFLTLGLTGGIAWIARMIPQSVTMGLQLGLGLAMAWIGFELMLDEPWLGFPALAVFLAAARVTSVPVLPLTIAGGLAGALAIGPLTVADLLNITWAIAHPVLPAPGDFFRALELAVLPQIPLTLANAIIVTAAVSQSLFPGAAARVTERHLSLTTGLGNMLLTPLGALPMCHGAGGVAAQARFGARSGKAPIVLGALLISLAALYGDAAGLALSAIPLALAGALLAIAGLDLALSRRLFEARPDCWPVIGGTAALTALVNPALALAVGIAMESGRRLLVGASDANRS